MSPKSTSANLSYVGMTREELVEDLEKSRAEIARLKNIIVDQQKILDVRKASPVKRDEEVRPERADTLKEELLEKQRALEALNEKDIHVEELSARNEELLDSREALRKTEEEFRTIFDRAGVAILMADAGTGEIIDCNAKAEELIGRPREEIVGFHHTRLHPAEMAAERRDAFERNARRDPTTNFETVVQHRDGRVIPVIINAARITVNGRAVMLGLFMDITERKRLEKELKLTQFSVEKAADEVFWMESDGRVSYVNDATCRVLGYSRQELQGMYVWDFDPAFSPERWLESFTDLKNKGFQNFETVHKTRDGRVFPVEITANYVEYDGKAYGFAFVRDITERKRAEKALVREKYILTKSQEVAHLGNWALDMEAGEFTGSDENDRIHGFEPGDVKPTTEWVLSRVHPEDRAVVADLMEARIRDGKRESIDYRVIRPDGSVRYVNAIVDKAVRDKAGKVKRLYGITQDITERKRAEEALRESEEKFRVLAETTKAGISLYRGDKSIYANPTLEKMSGYTNAELLSINVWDHVHPDYREIVKNRAMDRQRGLSVPEIYEFPVITKDGETRWLEVSAGLIKYQGEPTRIATYFDITERKQAEEKLKKSQYILAKSQEMAHVGNWAWNPLTGEINGSDESYRIFGYAPEEVQLTVDRLMARVHPDDRAMLEGLLESARSEGKRSSVDYRIMRPDGSMRYVNALADKIVRDDDGNVWWVYGIMQDITERKQTEKALAEAKARVELYIDLMGHDINNMNQSAQGFLELALQTLEMDGKIGPGGKVLIEKPLQAIESSSRLISNVQKLQRLADEGMKTRPVDLHNLFEELKSLDFHVGDRDATINIHDAPRCLVDGSDLLRDVFFNLISNAVKHAGPDRPVTIDVRAERVDQEGRAYYRCMVEDDGPGVPDELKPRLFHRFQRGTTKAHGKGLGLYIVRTLVEGYHGKVWVEDMVKGDHTKGARFVVLLPAAEY